MSTIVFAAASPLLADIGGVYPKNNELSALVDEDAQVTADNIPADVAPHSIDPQSQRTARRVRVKIAGPPWHGR